MSTAGEPLSATPADERPRERLSRLGASALTDAEILALVLGSGRPGQNVVALSRSILAEVGGFSALAAMPASAMLNLPGLGPASVGRLVAGLEMWRRSALPAAARLTDAASVAVAILPELADRTDERFLVLVADRDGWLRNLVPLDRSEWRHARVEPARVIHAVLSRGGSAFAVAHNHPGGSTAPSVADTAFTRELRFGSKAVGVRFLDHVVVAGSDWRRIE